MLTNKIKNIGIVEADPQAEIVSVFLSLSVEPTLLQTTLKEGYTHTQPPFISFNLHHIITYAF